MIVMEIIDKIFKDFHEFIDVVKSMKFLGSTKITGGGSIQIIKDAAKILDVKIGDHVLFYDKDGEIVIRKG
jgi:hypothetical protein